MHQISHNNFLREKGMGQVTWDLEAMISILDFILNAKGRHLRMTQFVPLFTQDADERMNSRRLRIEALR